MSPIKPEHTYDLVEVSGVEIEEDGSAVVFVRQEINKETMKRESRIAIQSLADGDAVDVAKEPGDSAPRLSADGESLAFLRSGEDNKKQVWVMPVDGGDARQVTRLPDGAKDMAWSPDGSRIAFVTDCVEGRDFMRGSEVHVMEKSGGRSRCWSQGLSRAELRIRFWRVRAILCWL